MVVTLAVLLLIPCTVEFLKGHLSVLSTEPFLSLSPVIATLGHANSPLGQVAPSCKMVQSLPVLESLALASPGPDLLVPLGTLQPGAVVVLVLVFLPCVVLVVPVEVQVVVVLYYQGEQLHS